MTKIEFKRLDIKNWLQPDPASNNLLARDVNGQPRVMTGEDWLRLIFRPHLIDNVPLEIKHLFEVARGTMAYGLFFYPVYSLAVEQLFRVADAAIKYKCRAHDAPQKIQTFEKRLEWLKNEGLLSSREEHSWQKIRIYRNESSHPEDQMILPPSWTVDFLDYVTERINSLFI